MDKELLEKLKRIYDQSDKAGREIMEKEFPEIAKQESEDDKMRKEIQAYLDWLYGKKDCEPKGQHTIREMCDWLDKQKSSQQMIAGAAKEAIFPDYNHISVPQKDRAEPKKEWSEEDEKMLNRVVKILDDFGFKEFCKSSRDQDAPEDRIYYNEISWLQKLKPQPHWKPSEEQ